MHVGAKSAEERSRDCMDLAGWSGKNHEVKKQNSLHYWLGSIFYAEAVREPLLGAWAKPKLRFDVQFRFSAAPRQVLVPYPASPSDFEFCCCDRDEGRRTLALSPESVRGG